MLQCGRSCCSIAIPDCKEDSPPPPKDEEEDEDTPTTLPAPMKPTEDCAALVPDKGEEKRVLPTSSFAKEYREDPITDEAGEGEASEDPGEGPAPLCICAGEGIVLVPVGEDNGQFTPVVVPPPPPASSPSPAPPPARAWAANELGVSGRFSPNNLANVSVEVNKSVLAPPAPAVGPPPGTCDCC